MKQKRYINSTAFNLPSDDGFQQGIPTDANSTYDDGHDPKWSGSDQQAVRPAHRGRQELLRDLITEQDEERREITEEGRREVRGIDGGRCARGARDTRGTHCCWARLVQGCRESNDKAEQNLSY